MHLQYLSDLHLEFQENKDYIEDNPIIPAGEILIMAGDIMTLRGIHEHRDFFDDISAKFRAVYWIPGNHEYYHYDLAQKKGSFCEAIRPNVFLLNNQAVTIDHVRLIFSTMWTKLSPANYWQIQRGMNDFRVVRYGNEVFSCDRYNELHQESMDFIESQLAAAKPAQKTVVVTHHVPTVQHYPPKYLGSVLNEAFAVELSLLLEDRGPDYWIYGHHHANTPDFTIGKTRLLTNQLGYTRYDEHFQFKADQIISL